MLTSLPLVTDASDWDVEGRHVLSPTQISTFLECERKWGWQKIANVHVPQAPSAALGSRVHALLELYLGQGIMPDFVVDREAAEVASSGLHLLPQRIEGMQVERAFRFASKRTGFVYRGFKDLELPPGAVMPGLTGERPIVLDHKTTSSIDKYAKTPNDLHFDAQAIIYAIDSMTRFERDEVDLAWVYYQTKGARRAHPSFATIEAAHASRVFDEIERVAEQAADALDRKLDVLELAPNPAACNAYGGCPFRHLCNLSPAQAARSRMSNSLIASLRSRVQSQTPPPAPSPEPEAPPVTEAAINPPEAAIAAPVPVEEPKAAEPTEPPKKRGRPKKNPDPVAADAHAATSVVETKPEPAEVVASDGAEKAEASGVIVDQYETKEYSAVVIETPGVVKTIFTPKGFTLYVDCMPLGSDANGREAKLASSFFEKANADIESVHKVPDYRLVDYGKGAPLFAASVLEQVQASGKDVIVDTRTPEGTVCLEALQSKAAFVVRGLR